MKLLNIMNKELRLITLAMTKGLSYVAFQANTFQTVQEARGRECENIANVALLLGCRILVCASEVSHYIISFQQNHPRMTPTQPINNTELFSGCDVDCQIPSSQWKVDHHWMLN